VQEAQGAGEADTPAFESPDTLAARLADYLGRAGAAPVSVDRLTKFPAGFSWRTYGVRLRGFPGADEAILRVGPPYGLFAPYSAMPEFRIF